MNQLNNGGTGVYRDNRKNRPYWYAQVDTRSGDPPLFKSGTDFPLLCRWVAAARRKRFNDVYKSYTGEEGGGAVFGWDIDESVLA